MPNNEKEIMTEEETKVLAGLRNKGYAVVVFTEEELGGASSSHVEDRLIEIGWGVIESLQDSKVN
jgi:hypothetical protein